jgi:hypothetical protein
VNGLGRHRQRLAGAVRLRLLTVDRVLERPFQDVDDLLAGVLVPDDRRFRPELDPVLDHHAPGDGEIVLLQIRASDPRRLLHCFVCCHDSSS